MDKEKVVDSSKELVINRIYTLRDTKIMFDFDLSNIYQIETRALKQVVKRDIKRFPNDFMFELTKAIRILMLSLSDGEVLRFLTL